MESALLLVLDASQAPTPLGVRNVTLVLAITLPPLELAQAVLLCVLIAAFLGLVWSAQLVMQAITGMLVQQSQLALLESLTAHTPYLQLLAAIVHQATSTTLMQAMLFGVNKAQFHASLLFHWEHAKPANLATS
jgi:hypothetical protein